LLFRLMIMAKVCSIFIMLVCLRCLLYFLSDANSVHCQGRELCKLHLLSHLLFMNKLNSDSLCSLSDTQVWEAVLWASLAVELFFNMVPCCASRMQT
jgi:hypothetical protein